jgi:hypothetical protein
MDRCWSCEAAVDQGDRYCRRCGSGQGDRVPWYYRPVWLLVLGLTVMGPFVLPLVWRSPRLDRAGKWLVSAVVLAACVWITWELVVAVRELGRALSEL